MCVCVGVEMLFIGEGVCELWIRVWIVNQRWRCVFVELWFRGEGVCELWIRGEGVCVNHRWRRLSDFMIDTVSRSHDAWCQSRCDALHDLHIRDTRPQPGWPEDNTRLEVGCLLQSVEIGTQNRCQVGTAQYEKVPDAVEVGKPQGLPQRAAKLVAQPCCKCHDKKKQTGPQ